MKVLIVSYKADISGGSNRSLLSIIDCLIAKNAEVILILPKKEGAMYEEAFARGIECRYMPYSRIGVKKPNSAVGRIKQQLLMRVKLLRDSIYTYRHKSELEALSLDVVYTNGSAIHAGRIISKVLNIPHVWHVREFFGDDQLLPANIYKMMCKRTDRFILISNDLKADYAKHISEEKLTMISNGIIYVEQPEKQSHEGFNLLLTGRITKAKCQIDAVKALEILVKERGCDSIYLSFAGQAVNDLDVRYMEELEMYIKGNNLDDHITFLGEVTSEKLSEIRQVTDVELMCSSREPFGRVTVEAMRSGVAVVGANSGGTRDIIIDGENGFFYEMGNTEMLADKILNLYHNPELLKKISQQAREFSKTHFTEAQLQKTVDLIYEMASASNA